MKWLLVVACVSAAALGLESACVHQSCEDLLLPMLELRLTDESTGEPVCDASVRAYRVGDSASSAAELVANSCLYQQLRPVGLGRYTVQVERQGYVPLTFEYEVTRKNDCDIILTEHESRSLQRDPDQPLEVDAGVAD